MQPSSPDTETDSQPLDLGEIVVLNRDLFFGVRIGNTLRGLGYRVSFTADSPTFAARITALEPPPVLGVIDMGTGVDWDLIRSLTARADLSTPLLVFGSHLDVEGLRAAKAAGVTRVVSNGDFHRGMVDLVRRYARPPAIG